LRTRVVVLARVVAVGIRTGCDGGRDRLRRSVKVSPRPSHAGAFYHEAGPRAHLLLPPQRARVRPVVTLPEVASNNRRYLGRPRRRRRRRPRRAGAETSRLRFWCSTSLRWRHTPPTTSHKRSRFLSRSCASHLLTALGPAIALGTSDPSSWSPGRSRPPDRSLRRKSEFAGPKGIPISGLAARGPGSPCWRPCRHWLTPRAATSRSPSGNPESRCIKGSSCTMNLPSLLARTGRSR
jgi:hypothetical protein